MTWEVGQVVVVAGGTVPIRGFERHTVVEVYTNGGCRLDDGTRWTARGRKFGSAGSKWSIVRLFLAKDIEEWEAEEMARNSAVKARWDIEAAAKSCTDIARLERALAVLRGEA